VWRGFSCKSQHPLLPERNDGVKGGLQYESNSLSFRERETTGMAEAMILGGGSLPAGIIKGNTDQKKPLSRCHFPRFDGKMKEINESTEIGCDCPRPLGEGRGEGFLAWGIAGFRSEKSNS
jgi:hypothetical protein